MEYYSVKEYYKFAYLFQMEYLFQMWNHIASVHTIEMFIRLLPTKMEMVP